MAYPYFQTKSISWATETTTARCNFAPQPQVYWASPTAAACSAPATPSFGVGMGATSTCTADVLGSNSSNEVSMAMRGMKTVPWIHGFFQFLNEHSNIDQGSKFRGRVLENYMYCGPKGISSCLDVWSAHRGFRMVEPSFMHQRVTTMFQMDPNMGVYPYPPDNSIISSTFHRIALPYFVQCYPSYSEKDAMNHHKLFGGSKYAAPGTQQLRFLFDGSACSPWWSE